MKILIFILLSLTPLQSFSAVVATPTTPGLATNAATGNYLNNQAGSLQKMFDQASRTYGPGSSTVQVGGRTATVATKIPLSSTAGNIVKNALKLNPTRIVGTLAAGWLIEKGLTWLDDQKKWVIAAGDATLGHPSSGYSSCSCTLPACAGTEDHVRTTIVNDSSYGINSGGCVYKASVGEACEFKAQNTAGTAVGWGPKGNWNYVSYSCAGTANPAVRDMTDEDWNNLSDPTPTVAPELPGAPYMPDGAPVGTPQFSPGDVIIGAPYTKADGSTAEPRAKITDNLDGTVTIDTYEKSLTNPDGTPAPTNAPITDTSEPPLPPPDPCIANPDRIGCMNAGTDTFAMPKKDIAFTFTPEASPISAGSCPAPRSVLGHQLSYQPMCDAMGMIRALIIALSSLTAAYILVGAFKGGD